MRPSYVKQDFVRRMTRAARKPLHEAVQQHDQLEWRQQLWLRLALPADPNPTDILEKGV